MCNRTRVASCFQQQQSLLVSSKLCCHFQAIEKLLVIGANNYFTVCSTDYLALGGGGHFALYLDGDL
jgi:hypothetical protein